VAVRQRRDFGQLLTLVQAHALLHRESRERDGAGRVVTTFEDYAIVRELVADLFAEAAGTEVSGTVRETVEAIAALLEAKPAGRDERATVTVVEVWKRLRLDKSAAARRVRAAKQAGCLDDLETWRGRPSRLVLGEPLPDRLEILPPPEQLQADAAAEPRGREPEPCSVAEPLPW
jgi:hypothetical protein